VNNKEANPPRLEVAAQPSCVSVIIPTRNRPRLLHSALDSVFRLSGPDLNLQVIVVDDAPSEETRLVAAEFGARHVATIGRGAAAARNTGIREATDTFIAFLDDDDVWLPGHVRSHLALLEGNPALAAVVGQAQAVSVELEPTGSPWQECWPEDGRFFKNFLREYPQFGTTMIRTSAFNSVGFLDESLESDEDWHLRLSLSHPMGFVPKPCVLFRRRAPGTWDDLRWERLALMRRVYLRNARRAGAHKPNAVSLIQMFLRHDGVFAEHFLLRARMQGLIRMHCGASCLQSRHLFLASPCRSRPRSRRKHPTCRPDRYFPQERRADVIPEATL
jgi:glycosyltransferase involved in cell wall biosynthesis